MEGRKDANANMKMELSSAVVIPALFVFGKCYKIGVGKRRYKTVITEKIIALQS